VFATTDLPGFVELFGILEGDLTNHRGHAMLVREQEGLMGSAKRQRRREKREAREIAANPLPSITDEHLMGLLSDLTVRDDCEHASTRSSPDGLVLIRCAVEADIAGGCARDCAKFERRRIGGIGLGLGAS
jgi:hypothetical protein